MFDIHAEHGVDTSFLRYPRDPFPTQLLDFKDTQVGKNYTIESYVRNHVIIIFGKRYFRLETGVVQDRLLATVSKMAS